MVHLVVNINERGADGTGTVLGWVCDAVGKPFRLSNEVQLNHFV